MHFTNEKVYLKQCNTIKFIPNTELNQCTKLNKFSTLIIPDEHKYTDKLFYTNKHTNKKCNRHQKVRHFETDKTEFTGQNS